MSTYEFFKDFAGPLSTASAALAAALVTGLFAYRQAKTAELQAEIALDKLKYETFEARHDVLDAARDLFGYCNERVIAGGVIDEANALELISRIKMGQFYFGRQVCRMLNTYVRAAEALRASQGIVWKKPDDIDEALHLRDAAHKTFKRSAALVEELLEYDLSLNLLKRGSDHRHGSPEKLRRARARRAFYRGIWTRMRRPFSKSTGLSSSTSASPKVDP